MNAILSAPTNSLYARMSNGYKATKKLALETAALLAITGALNATESESFKKHLDQARPKESIVLLAQAKTEQAIPEWYKSVKAAEEKLIEATKKPSLADRLLDPSVLSLKTIELEGDMYNRRLESLGLTIEQLNDDERFALFEGTRLIDANKITSITEAGKGGIVNKSTGERIKLKPGLYFNETRNIPSWAPYMVLPTLERCNANIPRLEELDKEDKLTNRGKRRYWILRSVQNVCQKLTAIDQKANPERANLEYALLRDYLKELGFRINLTKEAKGNITCKISFEEEKTTKLIETSPLFMNFLKEAMEQIENTMRLLKQTQATR